MNQSQEFVLPRLSIAIYSLEDHLLEISSQLMVDRRFINSKINVFGGGIDAAIKIYKNTITPNVLIIEVDGSVSNMISQLYELSEVCSKETYVVIAGKRNDVELYRELLRHGISDYFVLPTTTLGLISVINNLYKEESAPLSPSAVFIGASGGAGASIISQSVALCLAEKFKIDTIYTDLDTAYPLSSLSWSLVTQKNIELIIQNAQDIVEQGLLKSCLIPVTDNLNLLTAPSDPTLQWNEEHAERLINCFTAVRGLADFSIVDIPAGQLTIEKRVAISTATQTFIVTEPTIKGIRNLGILYNIIKNLRPNDEPPKVILNKIDAPDCIHLEDKVIYANINILPDYYITYLPEVIDLAIARGMPVSSCSGSDTFNHEILNITNQLLGNSVVQKSTDNIVYKIIKDIKKTIGL
jgi:pilus assembly protein CpaE